MDSKYRLQLLDITSDWKIIRHVFYDIDYRDSIPDRDKYDKIYYQEDLFLLNKGQYYLDLGWYGSDNLINELTGYCIHLIRGNNWNDSELLEKFRTKDKQVVTDRINKLIKLVDSGYYENLAGYKVNENDPANKNDFNDLDTYTI